MSRRLAYADPPYPGQAVTRYGGTEVNHRLLIAHLNEFDGWALSTSASALPGILALCPDAVRVAAWCKPWASNGWSRVRYSWEPVLFVTDRRGIAPGERSEVWDSLVAAPDTGGRHVVPGVAAGKGSGSKPAAFVKWVADLLDLGPNDEWVDIFPGSGACAHVRQELPFNE